MEVQKGRVRRMLSLCHILSFSCAVSRKIVFSLTSDDLGAFSPAGEMSFRTATQERIICLMPSPPIGLPHCDPGILL